MTTGFAIQPAFARRYARAYVDLLAKKQYKDARDEVSFLINLMEESADLDTLIRNPLFSTADKISVIEEIFKKYSLSADLFQFVATIAQNGRLTGLPKIMKAVFTTISDELGEVFARVESAYELNKTQTTKLEKEISNMTGGKAFITMDVNPELIGGVVITIGSRRIDGSVKRRLELLEQELRSSVNENTDNKKTA